MARDVWSAMETPWRTSAPSSASRAAALSLIRMSIDRNPRVEQHGQLFRHPADTPRADRHHRVARTRFAQHEFDAALQRARVDDGLVSRRADCLGKLFAGVSVPGRLDGGLNS